MGMTGHRNEVSGIYQSNCACKEEIALTQGNPFPPCGRCKKL